MSRANVVFWSLMVLAAFLFSAAGPAAALDVDQDGWTVITESADTRKVYVSNSGGDDGNDGLSPSTAVKTVSAGWDLIRDSYPDWLLFKRGDTFTETIQLNKSGRGGCERLVIGTYGTGSRPLFKTGTNRMLDARYRTSEHRVIWNAAIVGLEGYGHTRDPDSPDFGGYAGESGMHFVSSGGNILIEDCKARYYNSYITFDTYDPSTSVRYENLEFRRNIIVNAWCDYTAQHHCVGVYVSGTDGILLEENLFDHNGWSEDPACTNSYRTMFSHNAYMQYGNTGCTSRGNIYASGASHGTHQRPGGLSEDNLFVGNAISLQMGYNAHPQGDGVTATARDNVILEGERMDPSDSSYPRTGAVWGIQLEDIYTATVDSNIVAHRTHDGNVVGIADDASTTYIDNIIYDWDSGQDMWDSDWQDPERSRRRGRPGPQGGPRHRLSWLPGRGRR